MRSILRQALAAGLFVMMSVPPAATAHSLDDLQAQLGENEQYFEPRNEPAPDFSLQDAAGNTVRLKDLRSQVVVLNFVYTQCPDVCPLHAETIARVQKMVNITPMKDRVTFVTVTTDPVRDTPDILRGYGDDHGLDPANWRFLTSGPERPEQTRKLAEAFGHKFKVTEDGLQLHGIVTHVIDQNGVWRGNFHGLAFQPVNLVSFVNALTNDRDLHDKPADPSWWTTFRSLF